MDVSLFLALLLLLPAQLLLTGAWLKREGALGLNIDARDTVGRTALFNATLNAHIDVASFLLDLGACECVSGVSMSQNQSKARMYKSAVIKHKAAELRTNLAIKACIWIPKYNGVMKCSQTFPNSWH